MLELPPFLLVLVAMCCGGWMGVAIWATLHGLHAARMAEAVGSRLARGEALLAASPTPYLVCLPSGDIEVSERAAVLIGVAPGTQRIERMVPRAQAEDLLRLINATAASGATFSHSLALGGGSRMVACQGHLAPETFPRGTVLLWLSETPLQEQMVHTHDADTDRLSATVDALTGLLEAAPFPIWYRGPDLRLALVNGAYVRAVEGGAALAVVRSGIELIDEGEGRSALARAASVLKGGEPVSRTVPATIAGTRRIMHVVEIPISGGVAGYAIDVEEREQARAELERFVKAQRDLLDRFSAGVVQFGRDRHVIFANGPFMRLFGLGADFLGDHPEFDRLLDRLRERRALPEVRDFPDWKRDKRSWFLSDEAMEEDWLLPGGKHLRVVPQPLPDGGLLLIFEDRTEQNELASARDTLLRVRTATFNNLFEAIGVFASDGRLYLWNDRFREVWGFEEEQLAAHPRIDALLPGIAGKLKRRSLASYVRELVRSATVERKQRNGRVGFADGRDFAFAAVPLPDGNALFTMLDITDSRRIEGALRERNDALEQADRVKTAFMSNMSYELRTPLTSINGFAEMLAAGYAGPLPPAASEYVAAITASAERLSMLVDNVLDLTQSDIGPLPLADEQVDIGALCGEVAEQEANAAAGKDIVVALELDPASGEVTGDGKRLAQALGSLVRNAIAYTGEGGRVLIRAGGSSRAVEIVISDNGCGIAEEDQARVFERFGRAVEDARGERGSLGLGLPLARQIVEAHGGSMRLDSAVGVGTSVTVFLPRGR